MPQQINLYSTALQAPRQRFAAQTLAMGLGVTALLIVIGCLGVQWQTHQVRHDAALARAQHLQDKQHLSARLASLPSTASTAGALEQQLAQTQAALQQRHAVLDELMRGRLDELHRRSALLRRVAQTVPSAVWLTQVDIDDQRLTLHGRTLEPDSLRPWLAQLNAQPYLPEQPLAGLKIERDGAAPATTAGTPEPWRFTLVSQTTASLRAADNTAGAAR